jgi:hypothetical protein
MSVVARLRCDSVTNYVHSKVATLMPVTAQGDEHEEEIKQFFAATPGGTVTWNIAEEEDQIEPGDQVYLHLFPLRDHRGGNQLKVKQVRLDGWATYVELEGRDVEVIDGITHSKTTWTIALTIRNEVAAEQFQPGATFTAQAERVPTGA